MKSDFSSCSISNARRSVLSAKAKARSRHGKNWESSTQDYSLSFGVKSVWLLYSLCNYLLEEEELSE